MLYVIYIRVMVVLIITISSCLCLIEDEDDEITDAEKKLSTPSSTQQAEVLEFQIPDEKWVVNAFRDIAYFLRNHKFNEWDRRYYREKPNGEMIGFYHSFPLPSLSSLHWNVQENCNKDFYKCIIYLYSIVETSPLARSDDVTSILSETLTTNDTLIIQMNGDCKKAIMNIEKTGLPFEGPGEKFQWRTSASYYMCWYTMKGIPALSMLGEACDNFANCLDSKFGKKNRDPRSDDRMSFACAMYSFCPDPCCPMKHVNSLSQCHNNKANPCFLENMKGKASDRQCRFDRKQNQDLDGVIDNKWNVTCHCEDKGFIWKSQFGMCVDINECLVNTDNCDNQTQDCLNLPGSFQCTCKWGYSYDASKKKCVAKDTTIYSYEDVNNLGVIDKLKCILRYIGF